MQLFHLISSGLLPPGSPSWLMSGTTMNVSVNTNLSPAFADLPTIWQISRRLTFCSSASKHQSPHYCLRIVPAFPTCSSSSPNYAITWTLSDLSIARSQAVLLELRDSRRSAGSCRGVHAMNVAGSRST
ncbi:uncharacterized protein LAESUDRAFT_485264 [Laetiporus sulphureus 93-53]|uniref:Uncharacterized protein n=1 Tax=Laetiporus sulphureus 93-53 TaxID=1314785 RepID=A0A165BMW6_9APHY|nr:uncharacterized protein LAESUDRAFT_485264 [Laetiporus sulphureus 93-53]KZT01328.1 hypothetical protein LAESUDRAFT_485264 [Laetiporus sulphureus 93-53]